LNDRINELDSDRKNKSNRDINKFKKSYQPRTNLVKGKRGGILADYFKITNRCKNYFCWLMNAQGADVVRQTEMHTGEPFVPEPSASELLIAIGNLKRSRFQ
jgi:hypothetical protein